jgi:hypothetical protein
MLRWPLALWDRASSAKLPVEPYPHDQLSEYREGGRGDDDHVETAGVRRRVATLVPVGPNLYRSGWRTRFAMQATTNSPPLVRSRNRCKTRSTLCRFKISRGSERTGFGEPSRPLAEAVRTRSSGR